MKKQKAKQENAIKYVIIGIIVVFVGLYGIYVSLMGGFGYVNSSDKQTVRAEVTSVKHKFNKDYTEETWEAKLSYTINGKTYTIKQTYGSETYTGEHIWIDVYKTSKGEYKEAKPPSGFGFVISTSILIVGAMILMEENKSRKKKRANSKKQIKKIDQKKRRKMTVTEVKPERRQG